MHSVRSSSRFSAHHKQWRSEVTTCQVHRLNAGLGSVTTSFWERATRVLHHFGVQKTKVQYEAALEVVVPDAVDIGPTGLDAVAGVSGPLVGSSDTAAAGSSSTHIIDNNNAADRVNGGGNGGSDGGSSGGYSIPSVQRRTAINLEVRIVDSISKVPREEWDAVAVRCGTGEVNPFLLWSFLHALEESGSAAPRAGWLPQHILVRQVDFAEESDSSGSKDSTRGARPTGRLVGCVPLYLKGHSYGEYVFDNSWADFASMLGIRYYPKLQAAVPFTPVTGPRLMVSADLTGTERTAAVRALGRALIDLTDSMGLSGAHLTFTTAEEWAVLGELGFKQRLGIQFHWDNNDYSSFEDFLADLKQSKRKSIRQERRSVERAGLSVHRLSGGQLRAAHWDRFHSFYLSTVERKWGNAYLTREFFQRLGEEMPERVLLVAACEGTPSSSSSSAPAADQLVAGALNLVGSHALFGRNWGQEEGQEYRNLHFEMCYYQALEEAISRRLPRVEAGAQGEHKLQRGYLPSFTYSCHYLRDPRLGAAVDTLLSRERGQIEYTLQMMSLTSSPYKKERTVEALVGKLRSYNRLSSVSSGPLDQHSEERE